MIELGTNDGTNAKRPVSRARHKQRRDSWMFPNVTGNSQPDSMKTGALVLLAAVELDSGLRTSEPTSWS